MSEFIEFPKIARLFRDCCITEKIDGSNAQILIPEDDSPILAGSRNRWLTVEADNFGFARWVADHADELRALGPGRHFGEWWGAGIQRRYGQTAKRFSLFNVARWTDDPSDTAPVFTSGDPRTAPKLRTLAPSCCSVVPILYRGPFTEQQVHGALEALQTNGSAAAPGFMQPEGIVLFHDAANKLFKVTLGGDGHKEARVRKAS